MTNALKRLRIQQTKSARFSDQRRLKQLQLMMSQTGQLVFCLGLSQLTCNDPESARYLQSVLDNCQKLQHNIRMSISVTEELIACRNSKFESGLH